MKFLDTLVVFDNYILTTFITNHHRYFILKISPGSSVNLCCASLMLREEAGGPNFSSHVPSDNSDPGSVRGVRSLTVRVRVFRHRAAQSTDPLRVLQPLLACGC